MTDEVPKCFRCGAQPKIIIQMDIDHTLVPMCPQCVADFGLFMQGNAIHRYIYVERGREVKKEAEE